MEDIPHQNEWTDEKKRGKKMTCPFLTDIAAHKMWQATGWVMENPSVQAFAAQQATFSWRRM